MYVLKHMFALCLWKSEEGIGFHDSWNRSYGGYELPCGTDPWSYLLRRINYFPPNNVLFSDVLVM